MSELNPPALRQNSRNLLYQEDMQGNAVLCTTDGARYTGLVFEALPGGFVTTEYELKDGIKDGVEKAFYGDGSVECLAHYRHGLLHGEVIYFHGEDVPKEKLVFAYGILLEVFEWDELGNLLSHNQLDPTSARFTKVVKLRERYNW